MYRYVRYLFSSLNLFSFCLYDDDTDPIYEDELNASNGDRNGMAILGVTVDLDPTSLTLLGFGLIAFNFFVLANL